MFDVAGDGFFVFRFVVHAGGYFLDPVPQDEVMCIVKTSVKSSFSSQLSKFIGLVLDLG